MGPTHITNVGLPMAINPEHPTWPRRGLTRVQAASYVGVSPTKFDQMVTDGRMPRPVRIDGRVVWDVRELDVAFDALSRDDDPDHDASNPWD